MCSLDKTKHNMSGIQHGAKVEKGSISYRFMSVSDFTFSEEYSIACKSLCAISSNQSVFVKP